MKIWCSDTQEIVADITDPGKAAEIKERYSRNLIPEFNELDFTGDELNVFISDLCSELRVNDTVWYNDAEGFVYKAKLLEFWNAAAEVISIAVFKTPDDPRIAAEVNVNPLRVGPEYLDFLPDKGFIVGDFIYYENPEGDSIPGRVLRVKNRVYVDLDAGFGKKWVSPKRLELQERYDIDRGNARPIEGTK